jgi:hypothetical protein
MCAVLAAAVVGSVLLPATSGVAGASAPTVSPAPGYWLVGADGGVFAFNQPYYGSGYLSSPNACSFSPQALSTQSSSDGCDSIASVPGGGGYWLVNAYRSATGFGNANLGAGSACTSLNRASGKWVAVAASASGGGFWLASSNGGVMGCGDMPGPYGGTTSLSLDAPVVAMAPNPDGDGYWLAGSDGGVFAFGNAGFFGSMGGQDLNAPIVGIAPTSDGRGYWLVASDGGVFAFGDALFAGSMGGRHLNAPMTGIAANPSGPGYWTAASDGGVFAFGGAPYEGGMGGVALTAPVTGIASSPSFPGAPPCDQSEGENAPDVRPRTFFVGCATSADMLSSITWTSWTATEASGTGTHSVDNCVPNCASGSYTKFPVTVQLSAPGDLGGMDVFTTISMTPTTNVGVPETVTANGLYGSWGWVPN